MSPTTNPKVVPAKLIVMILEHSKRACARNQLNPKSNWAQKSSTLFLNLIKNNWSQVRKIRWKLCCFFFCVCVCAFFLNFLIQRLTSEIKKLLPHKHRYRLINEQVAVSLLWCAHMSEEETEHHIIRSCEYLCFKLWSHRSCLYKPLLVNHVCFSPLLLYLPLSLLFTIFFVSITSCLHSHCPFSSKSWSLPPDPVALLSTLCWDPLITVPLQTCYSKLTSLWAFRL